MGTRLLFVKVPDNPQRALRPSALTATPPGRITAEAHTSTAAARRAASKTAALPCRRVGTRLQHTRSNLQSPGPRPQTLQSDTLARRTETQAATAWRELAAPRGASSLACVQRHNQQIVLPRPNTLPAGKLMLDPANRLALLWHPRTKDQHTICICCARQPRPATRDRPLLRHAPRLCSASPAGARPQQAALPKCTFPDTRAAPLHDCVCVATFSCDAPLPCLQWPCRLAAHSCLGPAIARRR